MIRCSACGVSKSPSEFHVSRSRRTGRQARCKECANGRQREWNRANPDAYRQRLARDPNYFRHQKIKYRYGLTPEEFEALQVQQGERCAICGEERPLHLDHDHDSGRVRGLLCMPCNTSLGILENTEWVERAQAYLRTHATPLGVTPGSQNDSLCVPPTGG